MSPQGGGAAARRCRIIGIGMGSPAHLTAAAVEALRDCDVFLVPDKGEATSDIVDARRAMCESVLEPGTYRFVTVPDPERPSDGDPDKVRYRKGVGEWRNARAMANADIMRTLPDSDVVGFLAWGDPAFFDSTIRMVEEIAEHLDITWDVIPGIAAFQVLAAEAGVGLNSIGSSVHITPGRRLVEEWRPELGTVVVMLDSYLRVAELAGPHPDIRIVWGAYLGLPQQTIIRGRLGDVMDQIVSTRAELRERHGWLMDTYALWPPSH